MIGLSAAPAAWVMVTARERTPNRVVPLFARRCSLRASVRLSCLDSLMPNRGFCFGGRPGLAVACKIAGSVIPAICLTGETLHCVECAL